jgi:hypothetical protein
MSNAWPRTQWFTFIGFTLYFGLFLVPKVAPGFGASPFTFLLTLSLMLVVTLLVLLAIWGITALGISKLRKRPIGPRSKTAGQTALVGLSMFAAFLALGNVLPTPLPSGSYDKEFDRAAWLDLASADYTEGDITPRQKMLADVVKRLPGQSRTELEKMLGSSVDTPYFKSTGRDLIYITGPERDSFFGIDSEWLLIWLDKNGMYKRHAIVTD